ncbi:sodium/proton antiporter (NhaA family) [Halopolyspora algeriensis]|uniref:Na(+)/H(+) antiporter NhaA n=1 Tax=Halopolyspora algeriensis TaxID=1500506 RepID=A0A368VGC9_9ACTN|nr:Na+/H+ antiporter NhaA [Halopolyspora algeriensis]RCW40227.1 sodium/proton antiporter (NhaA family) [Halopolyspora algeriensis]TQM46292.1 sodium/proton antiporter (NhaA family) [Halopolyspora algeriensis]
MSESSPNTPESGDSGANTRDFNLAEFLRNETVGGIALVFATAVALILANTPASPLYNAVRDFHIGPDFLHLNLSVGDWAKDGLLAIFFFVAGLELKRELVVGELADRKRATLPVVAALGGMIVPAVLAYSVAHGAPGAAQAWAIPVATDIAFALGILSLTGSSIPSTARVFLLSLAVVDDLGAIIVIAVLFTSGLNMLALLAAVVLCAGYWYAQHKRITTPFLYVPLALAVWVAVHSSGVHATVAGVALGLLTRVRCDPGERASPSERLEHRLQPWSAGLVVPVFALFAAGVPIGAEALSELFQDRIAISVIVGLVLGKVLGIFGASFLAVKLGFGSPPQGVRWPDIAALGMLGGIGFTVSLLIAELSLPEEAAEIAKAAVLIASLIASLVAVLMLLVRGRRHRQAGTADL